ncbi:MAG: phage regulatory CII family protein [Phycisphaerae bacterium]
MKSWQVLQQAVDRVGVKVVAGRLNLSAALVYKWCEEPARDDPDRSGTLNPLDRVRTIYEVTHDPRLINWLCMVADGFYVANPKSKENADDREEELLGATQQMVEDFGKLLGEVSRSIGNDGRISPAEAERIRLAWERLKTQAESFAVACERGLYHK